MMAEPKFHCWKDKSEHIEEAHGFLSEKHLETYAEGWSNGTCILEENHEGPHVFTDDDKIGFRFAKADGDVSQ